LNEFLAESKAKEEAREAFISSAEKADLDVGAQLAGRLRAQIHAPQINSANCLARIGSCRNSGPPIQRKSPPEVLNQRRYSRRFADSVPEQAKSWPTSPGQKTWREVGQV
jgi:hypothetical protein